MEKQLAAVPFLGGAGEAADRTVGEPDQAFGRGEGRLVELAPLMREIASMALNEGLAERIRVILAGTGSLREVRMFGGLCFMLNGNMVAGTSKRGLLVRVGKGQHARALARADAKPMEMSGGPADGRLCLGRPAPARRANLARLARSRRSLREHLATEAAEIKVAPDRE